ncbi:EEIG1/EHBP1 N-terminal domain [Macleaya cordata]|uniref:EEIG1/EHBP1 N-terminal domain n=1 Tax=Macleaya cordata TaxID=56857 RepID=A0A200QGE9_MACCD|nr:EEIG1/EHBP1 N-terminal domain [Macleaya cordata]
MVLGLRTKNRKGASVQVDYLIHVQEIKPWPPSQSLKSVRSVLLQWENGDRNSGSIGPVVPSLGSGVGDGKIDFDESFRLPVTLSRDISVRGGDAEIYLKNCIEFNLYEPRRDKTVKGQLLGTVVVDLAEYGLVKETIIVSAPMNCKRSFRNTAQQVLSITIQPFDKHISSSTARESLLREASLDKDGKGSVSALMNGEYAEEAEIASFTDDDVSSHSSATISSSAFEATGSSPPQNEENSVEAEKDNIGRSTGLPDVPLEPVAAKSEVKPVNVADKHFNGSSSPSSSIDLSSGVESPENDHASLSSFRERSLTSTIRKSAGHSVQSSSSSLAYEGTEEEVISHNDMRNSESLSSAQEVHERNFNGGSNIKEKAQETSKENNTNNLLAEAASSDANLRVGDSQFNGEDDQKALGWERNGQDDGASTNGQHAALAEDKGAQWGENGQKEQAENEKDNSTQDQTSYKFSPDAIRKPGTTMGDTPPFSRRGLGVNGNTLTSNRLRHVKSVRSPLDSAKSNVFVGDNQFTGEIKAPEISEESRVGALSFTRNEENDAAIVPREARNSFSDSKVQQLEHRIEKLEGELREAAAMELALYSVVAEHGSSVHKVHAPARRLSRLYLHASKKLSQVSRASAARSAVSGLLLVAKACGNDVPRLTFWLSNSVVLRGIISLALRDSQLPVSAGPHVENNDVGKGNDKRSSSLKWKKSSLSKKENKFGTVEDWDDPHTFTTALEKIETWIFSRIVESVWWQTLTPYMQPISGKSSEKKMCSSLRGSYERQSSWHDQEQVNFSLDLWKKAFKDARERLCPVRASGHECGCLPVLARLVMEQCVARLDVAMFNAILRESAAEMPTDPVSDPISDSEVLPIPAGKSSFGAGAQLKNAIGNWSRWLTDLFGLDDDDLHHDENEIDADNREESEKSSKSFHLLNALSNLLMLPKDMLLNRSIRKEVCPTFDAPLIKRILQNFVPDEFCPDPVQDVVFDALDAEDPVEAEEEFIRNFPLNASPVVYSPTSADLLADIIGEVGKESQMRRSGSSLLRKSYTSDDELDELNSPVSSIIFDSSLASSTPRWTTKENGVQQVVRYKLLREVWKDED